MYNIQDAKHGQIRLYPQLKLFGFKQEKHRYGEHQLENKQTNKNLPVQMRDEYASRTTMLSHVPLCFAWVED